MPWKTRHASSFLLTSGFLTVLIVMPFFHHAKVIGYDLLGLDGFFLYSLLLSAGLFLTAITIINIWLHRLALAGVFSLCADYFLPQGPDVFTWAIPVFLIFFVCLLFMEGTIRQIVLAAAVAFLISDIITEKKFVFNHGVELRRHDIQKPPNQDSTKSPIIHIVLDAFQSPATLPQEVYLGISTFFKRHGFYLYEGAHSQYDDTLRSLTSAFNFGELAVKPVENVSKLDAGLQYEQVMARNGLLEDMQSNFYNLILVQPSYLNSCILPTLTAANVNCITYSINYWPIHQLTNLEVGDRLTLFALTLSREFAVIQDLARLTWRWARDWTWSIRSPIGTQSVEPLFADAISEIDSGSYVFFHSLATHSPYVMQSSCTVAAIDAWITEGGNNSPHGKTEALKRYTNQIECSLSYLDSVISRIDGNPMLEDALLIIHGDHGSRLSLEKAHYKMSRQDIDDNFSTLFAVRHKSIRPGTSSVPVTLDVLLKHYVQDGNLEPILNAEAAFIYLYQSDGTLLEHPLTNQIVNK